MSTFMFEAKEQVFSLEIWFVTLLFIFHWSPDNWLKEISHSIPSYATLHVCNLLCFAYVYANTYFKAFLYMEF